MTSGALAAGLDLARFHQGDNLGEVGEVAIEDQWFVRGIDEKVDRVGLQPAHGEPAAPGHAVIDGEDVELV